MTDHAAIAQQLHFASKARKLAESDYKHAVIAAKSEGWHNTEIARAVGVSEAAIRLYCARHNITSKTGR